MCVGGLNQHVQAPAIKVFQMDDDDYWWAATSAEEAVKDYLENFTPHPDDQPMQAHELSDEAMKRLLFTTDEGDKITFSEQLKRMISHPGCTFPCMFATTEF
jgi:hypothetical protein